MPVAIVKTATKAKVRLQNFRLLEFECGSKAALAVKLSLSLDELTQYLRKKPAPSPIGDAFAKTVEQVMGKPTGWMDRKNYDLALTADEWLLLNTYREGSNRDRVILSSLANTLGAMPEQK